MCIYIYIYTCLYISTWIITFLHVITHATGHNFTARTSPVWRHLWALSAVKLPCQIWVQNPSCSADLLLLPSSTSISSILSIFFSFYFSLLQLLLPFFFSKISSSPNQTQELKELSFSTATLDPPREKNTDTHGAPSEAPAAPSNLGTRRHENMQKNRNTKSTNLYSYCNLKSYILNRIN